jgi:hypothetical protein
VPLGSILGNLGTKMPDRAEYHGNMTIVDTVPREMLFLVDDYWYDFEMDSFYYK